MIEPLKIELLHVEKYFLIEEIFLDIFRHYKYFWHCISDTVYLYVWF